MDEITNFSGRIIYTTKGAAHEYGRIGCNFYTGCPHNCEYCYLKRGAPSRQLGGTEVQLKKCLKNVTHAAEVFNREIHRWLEPCQKYGVFLSFTTDPLIKETRQLTLIAIFDCLFNDIPVRILTKDATFINDDKFMEAIADIDNDDRQFIHFGFTLTGHDEMEPNASSNAERIDAMRQMKAMGFFTFASIEPVIDWSSAKRIIKDSLAWCDHYKVGLRSGVKQNYYNVDESSVAIIDIVSLCNTVGRTVYLKESTRKLLQGYLLGNAYKLFLSRTVDMDGNKIPLPFTEI